MLKKMISLCIILVLFCSLISCAEPSTELPEEKEDKYFCQQLSLEEQPVYWQIVKGIREHEEDIKINSRDGKRVLEIMNLVFYDNPEFFWVDFSGEIEVNTVNTTNFSSYCVLRIPYKYDLEQTKMMQAEIDVQAQEILDKMNAEPDTYQKIKTAYESIIDMVDYDETAEDSQTIYSALVTHRSVCSGYSRTFQYLLEQCKIPCIYVQGTSDGYDHAWNIVECDGSYYFVDVTWGDPVFLDAYGKETDVHETRYDYFCCGKEKFLKTHTPKDTLVLPECSGSDMEVE